MSFSVRSLRQIALVIAVAMAPSMVEAQHRPRRTATITIDEDVLATFVDEPCHHFERARDSFLARDGRTTAKELRIAAAFLKFEAVRSTPQGRANLETSIRELDRLAVSVQGNRVKSVKVLKQAFARAHFALAGHHCVQSARRCCHPATFQNKREMARTGYDLKAATIHLRRGLIWSGNDLDPKTQKMLDAAQLSAGKLINNRPQGSQNRVIRSIHSVHRKLEALTGRKILISPPLAIGDKLGPSINK